MARLVIFTMKHSNWVNSVVSPHQTSSLLKCLLKLKRLPQPKTTNLECWILGQSSTSTWSIAPSICDCWNSMPDMSDSSNPKNKQPMDLSQLNPQGPKLWSTMTMTKPGLFICTDHLRPTGHENSRISTWLPLIIWGSSASSVHNWVFNGL